MISQVETRPTYHYRHRRGRGTLLERLRHTNFLLATFDAISPFFCPFQNDRYVEGISDCLERSTSIEQRPRSFGAKDDNRSDVQRLHLKFRIRCLHEVMAFESAS